MRPKILYTLTFRLPLEVFIRRMKTSLQLVLGTVSSRCAEKTLVRMTVKVENVKVHNIFGRI